MMNVTKAIAACVGTIALACTAVQPAKAADMPQYPQQYPQYGGPPPVEQEQYVYQQQPRAYYQPAPPPVVYQEYVPPAPVPEPYYVPQRRVYVGPGYAPYGYRAYGYRPYVAGGYGYNRPHYHHHQHNHRHW